MLNIPYTGLQPGNGQVQLPTFTPQRYGQSLAAQNAASALQARPTNILDKLASQTAQTLPAPVPTPPPPPPVTVPLSGYTVPGANLQSDGNAFVSGQTVAGPSLQVPSSSLTVAMPALPPVQPGFSDVLNRIGAAPRNLLDFFMS